MRPRDQVYTTLKRRILLNDLPPEAALTELGLAQEHGCSQGTVREALLRLQEDGLVIRNGHQGTAVTPLDADAATEMLLLRRQMETRAATRAARAASPEILEKLTILVRDMEMSAAENDEYGLIELDTRFHMTIFQLSGFRALDQILQRTILHTHRQKLWEPRHHRSLLHTARRHQTIIAAMREGGEALAAALGEHIDTIVDIAPERLAS